MLGCQFDQEVCGGDSMSVVQMMPDCQAVGEPPLETLEFVTEDDRVGVPVRVEEHDGAFGSREG